MKSRISSLWLSKEINSLFGFSSPLRPQRSAPSRTRTWAVRPRIQRSDHWTTHATQDEMKMICHLKFIFGWILFLPPLTGKVFYRSGSARGGSGIPIYPKKNRQNTPKYPKFLQIYPKIIEALNTLYLKFKESDILNTHI